MMNRGLMIGALCMGLAGPVSAQGWSIIDFTSMPDVPSCVRQAEAAIDVYSRSFPPGPEVVVSDSTIGAYRLRGTTVDGIFICTEISGLVTPMLVVHNSDDDGEARFLIAERLADAWDAAAVGQTSLSPGTPKQ